MSPTNPRSSRKRKKKRSEELRVKEKERGERKLQKEQIVVYFQFIDDSSRSDAVVFAKSSPKMQVVSHAHEKKNFCWTKTNLKQILGTTRRLGSMKHLLATPNSDGITLLLWLPMTLVDYHRKQKKILQTNIKIHNQHESIRHVIE